MNSSRFRCLHVVILTSISVGGCAAVDDIENDQATELDHAEDVASASQELQSHVEFHWTQGSSPVPMGASSDRMCFLTGVQGKFEGDGESVQVYISRGSWYLGGTSKQHGVAAYANCVPLNWAGRSLSYSEEYSWSQGKPAVSMGGHPGRGCFLTRMTGKFMGRGERVSTYVDGNVWWLGGTSRQNSVGASARCLVNATTLGWFLWYQGLREPTWMRAPVAPSTDYACGLTEVTGKFRGAGEYVRAFEAGESWYLGGASKQIDVAAEALCVR